MTSAVVVLADGFEEIEAVTPIDLLRRAGVRVTVAGLNGRVAVGARGIRLECDALLADVPSDWDALVLPGGMGGATNLAQSPLIKSRIAESLEREAWVAAVCAAPAVVLGALGFLSGRHFTCYPGLESNVDGLFTPGNVVVDGRLITSRGVGTSGEFSLRLIEALLGPEKAAEVGRAVLLV